jgi:hypothetical protein
MMMNTINKNYHPYDNRFDYGDEIEVETLSKYRKASFQELKIAKAADVSFDAVFTGTYKTKPRLTTVPE